MTVGPRAKSLNCLLVLFTVACFQHKLVVVTLLLLQLLTIPKINSHKHNKLYVCTTHCYFVWQVTVGSSLVLGRDIQATEATWIRKVAQKIEEGVVVVEPTSFIFTEMGTTTPNPSAT